MVTTAERHDLATATSPPRNTALDQMAEVTIHLGHDIVDVAGFLDGANLLAKQQTTQLVEARHSANGLGRASQAMIDASEKLGQSIGDMVQTLAASAGQLSTVMGSSQTVLGWVSGLDEKLRHLDTAVEGAENSNVRILHIAREVNILAINAKIEAARAGNAGLGFAVVADAINVLSQQTTQVASVISTTVRDLATEIGTLRHDARHIAEAARNGLGQLTEADRAMSDLTASAAAGGTLAQAISGDAERMRTAMQGFVPSFKALNAGVEQQTKAVGEASRRVSDLITMSEQMIQRMIEMGGATSDQPMIEQVMARAQMMSTALEAAVARGEITLDALFSTTYREVPGSNPKQVIAPFTGLTDRLFPPFQEPALAQNPKVVFCAAVNRSGYLPTHNMKFSQAQGADPVWNAANCRNRRIFDDRVGLGAGRSTERFLMQIYRRDMGGAKFLMMKDVSAPIIVCGRHWGGLRLAYSF